jgi:hypothetical protein
VCGAEPTGDRAAAPGEEGAKEQDGESPGVALAEEGGHAGSQVLPTQREEAKIHGGSPAWVGAVSQPHLGPGAFRTPEKPSLAPHWCD